MEIPTTKGRTMKANRRWWATYVVGTIILITILYVAAHVALWIGRGLAR